MEIGLQFIFQNTHDGLSDADMMRKETDIALLAEDVGMDFLLAYPNTTLIQITR